jgi:hypothetical protein
MSHLDLDFQEKQGPGAWEHSQTEGEQWEDGQEDPESNGVQDCPGFDLFVRFAVPLHGLAAGYSEEFWPYNFILSVKQI